MKSLLRKLSYWIVGEIVYAAVDALSQHEIRIERLEDWLWRVSIHR